MFGNIRLILEADGKERTQIVAIFDGQGPDKTRLEGDARSLNAV
jgi:hypothetical protein